MPARALILDDLGPLLSNAVVVEIVEPKCCVPSCEKSEGVVFLSIVKHGGEQDKYGLCKKHLKEAKERHPSSLDKRHVKQGAFFS